MNFPLPSLLLAMTLSTTVAAETAAQFYAKAPPAGQCLELTVDLAASPGFSIDPQADSVELRYRMSMNNIAEGWSWQPGANPAVDDYYRYKFLPLQTEFEERGEYQAEDKIGVGQAMKVSWRYDYFLAFDNLYDFYPRSTDDEAGFVLRLTQAPAGPVDLRATACLEAPVTSESTTFWKAMYSRPTDFTLKKRYLHGRLERLAFHERDSGRLLGVVQRGVPVEQAR